MPHSYYPGTTAWYWQSANTTTATSAIPVSAVWNSTITAGTVNWYPSITTTWAGAGPSYPPQFWINGQLYHPEPATYPPRDSWRPVARRPTPAILREFSRAEHNARRALRRSIDLYARVRGRDEITRFVRGDQVIIQGHRFRYRVSKKVDLLRHTQYPNGGHIPYYLGLIDPANDRTLSHGCIVMENTPVIDQLLALALAVQHPERELRMLRTTNWSPRLPALLADTRELLPPGYQAAA